MPPKKPRRIVVDANTSGDDAASEKGASDKVDQWVVGIFARAQDGDGKQYYHVRWGADDEGKPFDVGKEEETWEPAEHLQACPDALNRFHEASRPPLPSEKDAMQPELECQLAQLTTPGQASKGEAGARAGLPTDAATAFLASMATLVAVTDKIRAVGDTSELLPNESVAECPASPTILTPSKSDFDDYGYSEDAMNHTVSIQRSAEQLNDDTLLYAGNDLLQSPGGTCATACLRQSPESPPAMHHTGSHARSPHTTTSPCSHARSPHTLRLARSQARPRSEEVRRPLQDRHRL